MGRRKKKGRLKLVSDHREAEFEKRFDQYRRGECSAEDVKKRADKMKAMKSIPREISHD